MKIAAYTRDKNVFNKIPNAHQKVVNKVEWQKTRSFVQKKYSSLQNYLDWGIQHVGEQFATGNYVANLFKDNNCNNILCLGSGDAYIEYTIKTKVPNLQLIVTDYDEFLIENLKKIQNKINTFQVVDIKKDRFTRYREKVDTIFMSATFYVLSDSEAVDFFKRLSILKPKNVFILAVAYLWPDDILKYIMSHYLGGRFIGKLKASLTGKTTFDKLPGRFHGWTRSESEFKKILKKEGSFKLKKVYRYKNNPHDHAMLHIVPTNR